MRDARRFARREHFVCGSLFLMLAGWVITNPLPGAPKLPSACQAHLAKKLGVTIDMPATKARPVWVDLRSGLYYHYTDPCYGRTGNGKYLEVTAAKAQEYHSAVNELKLE